LATFIPALTDLFVRGILIAEGQYYWVKATRRLKQERKMDFLEHRELLKVESG
jgi:hypothetical protein